ncbi:hypothetical protein KBD69_00415 [Candidatus Woesebacteria bacterium]|nr:hypothetical protein [Candidatus Woesebacteria bacterium]
MLMILKIISIISLWVVVAAATIYIDPVTIKDVLIPGLYLPMILIIGVATGYTAYSLSSGWKWVAISLFVMVLTGVLLLL